jgi:hypothetical protein
MAVFFIMADGIDFSSEVSGPMNHAGTRLRMDTPPESK